MYGYLHGGGTLARSGRPVRVAPGPRVLISPVTDALLRTIAAHTAAWAGRVRSVPGLSLVPPEHAHGTPERVHDDCRVLALHPGPLLALADGPTVRAYPWPLTPEEEVRLADCEIVRIGEDWVHIIEALGGMVAGAEILDLHYKARRLAGQVPAQPEALDGIPCRECEEIALVRAEPPSDPSIPAAWSRCTSCRDQMGREEYDEWVRMYEAWAKGAGILVCRRCSLDKCETCFWDSCGCAADGHPRAKKAA